MANLRLTRDCIFMIPVRFRDTLPARQVVGGGYTVSRYCTALHGMAFAVAESKHAAVNVGMERKGKAAGLVLWTAFIGLKYGFWRMAQDSNGRWDPQQKDATTGGFVDVHSSIILFTISRL